MYKHISNLEKYEIQLKKDIKSNNNTLNSLGKIKGKTLRT
jgi:ribosomal protein S17E